MDMISYWKDTEVFYEDDGLVLMFGWYDHKNQGKADKALGVYWGDNYPQSRGKLSPCVIPANTRNAILSGLLHQAVINGQSTKTILKAVDFFVK